ncbi:hypothetical protein B9Z55_022186 [Caenorhabditis nigoni]|uniref:Uncharacterized protein n=2 Tax=Caenorhabditis nigoni TaxID=1611254 RepID=A0A2G5SJJ0_9PELO|nr:hypothetical protein B9Z55_022186 [Caenorhabditis nigoni]
MADFNIDQYEITVTLDEDCDNEKGTIKPIYPDLTNCENEQTTECTVALEPDDCDQKDMSSEILDSGNTDSSVDPNLREWLLSNLSYHRIHNPAKIALIEEISEVRCVTYEELVDCSRRTANFMSHHGVKCGDRVLMCMENNVEYVFYQIATFLLGAIPVLINPCHIAAEKLADIGCTTAIVDFEHYGHVLRTSESVLKSIQRVFVLAEDIATISLARHVWIIDGFGFLSFSSDFEYQDNNIDCSMILPGSLETNQYVYHTQKSGFSQCHDYFEKLFGMLKKNETVGSKNHLITDGLHCHDTLSYLFTILTKGETCIIAETTLDVWRASLLDRISGIIEQYNVSLLFSNSQLLKCFIKYEVHKIYNLSSLEIIANHGAVVSVSTGKKIKEILNVILLQAYSGAEFGVASFGIFNEENDKNLLNCGHPISDMQIKVVAHMETDKEMEQGKWGQVILSGQQLFKEYVGNDELNKNRKFGKSWFKTGDFGMIDKNNQLHIEGALEDLITAQGKEISSERMETILCEHKLVYDIVVMQKEQQVWCGVLLNDENKIPTTESLEKLLKKHKVPFAINKLVVFDFIPRSEKGKIIRNLLSIPKRDFGDNEESSPLHSAVKMGNTIMAKNFIDSKSLWIDEPDPKGQTALHLSITYGDTEMASMLLKGGANVDALDNDGSSACHIACRDGMIDHFNLLVYYHADICSVDRAGRTPFDLACEHGQEKMIERLFNCGLKKESFQNLDHVHTASALHLAAETGQVQIISLLLCNNWDVNFTTKAGSALHMAAGAGQIQVVRFLLRVGVDVNITNVDGQTAYAFAKKQSGRNPITYKEIRFLLKNFQTFTNVITVEDYCGFEANELSLSKGDQVWVVERCNSGVFKGVVFGKKGNSRSGFFRSSAIREEENQVQNSESTPPSPKVKARKNYIQMTSRIAKNQKNPTSTFCSTPAPKPNGPRNCSISHYHDINRNTPSPMASFGRTTSWIAEKNYQIPTNSTVCTSFGSSFSGSRTSTPKPSTMYSSSTCLYPTKMENQYSSIGSSSSQSSSGFESAKCSTSTSASSFPSAVQSNESGRESIHSVRSVESGSGSSSSIHALDDSLYRSIYEIDVTGMAESGVPHAEILANWLDSIHMSQYLALFLKQGYDLQTIARCTPADLLTLGIKNPDHRKKLMMDIHSWRIVDQWPHVVPNNNLREWLQAIALAEYIPLFESQKYTTVQDVLDLQWEDFEDIGVKRLGHLKRFGLTIKKLKEHQRQTCRYPQLTSNKSTMNVDMGYSLHSHTYSSISDSRRSLNTSRINDPPPPAPSGPYRSFKKSSDKLDKEIFEKHLWDSATTLSSAHSKPIHLISKPKSTSDLLFGDDRPIRLSLVSTGKILSDISKLRKSEEEDEELEDPTECPPPPAPLHCNVGLHHTSSFNLPSSNFSQNNEQFPFANENCGTIKYSAGRSTSAFNVPSSLPPLLSDDHISDQSSNGRSNNDPTIDEMLQEIQGAMENFIASPASPSSTVDK